MIKFIRNVLELLDWSLLLPRHEARPIHRILDKRGGRTEMKERGLLKRIEEESDVKL